MKNRIINILKEARNKNKQVFCIGNGGSHNNASHMATDLFRTAGIKSFSLDNLSLITATINDNGWENLYVYWLSRVFNKGDILIIYSVHGGIGSDKAGLWSQNLIKAIDFFKKNSGITIGFCGFDGGLMKTICDFCYISPYHTTPEVESDHSKISHEIAFALKIGDRI